MFPIFRTTALAAIGAAPLCAMLPALSSATTFTSTQGSATDIVPSFSWTTPLSGAALDNLLPGTNFTSHVSGLLFQPRDVPTQDGLGFPIGGAFGSSYFNATSFTVDIGTNTLGQITSWSISEGIFASYPAVPGANPTDFYCPYTASTTTFGDSLTLTADHDVGVCPSPSPATTGACTFGASQTAAAPEPASLPLLAMGLVCARGAPEAVIGRKFSERLPRRTNAVPTEEPAIRG
jgi:hypothetical protein